MKLGKKLKIPTSRVAVFLLTGQETLFYLRVALCKAINGIFDSHYYYSIIILKRKEKNITSRHVYIKLLKILILVLSLIKAAL